jgi:hypothetical protein
MCSTNLSLRSKASAIGKYFVNEENIDRELRECIPYIEMGRKGEGMKLGEYGVQEYHCLTLKYC